GLHGLAEEFLQLRDLLLGVVLDGFARLDVSERDRDVHAASLRAAFAVPFSHENGPIGVVPTTLDQNSFLRLDDARMPSISRYLATVRRAIWIPSFFSSISTMAWSLKGFCLSSSSMIFLMACFTLSEAMSSSATRRIDELKKYLSSKRPWGVCTYLLVV